MKAFCSEVHSTIREQLPLDFAFLSKYTFKNLKPVALENLYASLENLKPLL